MSIHGPALRPVPGSSHFYEVHGCSALPSQTEGSPHSELPRRLAHPSTVRGQANISQAPPSQPLKVPGTQGQLCQELAVSQPMGLLPGSSIRLSPYEGDSHSSALAIQQLAASFRIGASHPLKTFQRMLGLMASTSLVLQLGLLRMRPLQYWLKPLVPPHAWPLRKGILKKGFKKNDWVDFYHYWMDVYTLPTHIYVQTTCKVNFASDDPFKTISYRHLLA